MEERFCKKLVMWKKQYISKGERLILIHNTLFSLPIYFMFFPNAEECLDKVGTNSKRFLMGRRAFKRKVSLSELGHCLCRQEGWGIGS